MKLFNIFALLSAWLLTKVQTKIKRYYEIIDFYSGKGLANYPNNRMNLKQFHIFHSKIILLDSRVTTCLPLRKVIEIYLSLIQIELQHMKEIDEMEKSISWFLLFDAMFFPKGHAW